MSAKTLLSALFLAVFVFILQVSYAQDRTITGKVTDSKDGSPVVGASVQAKGTRIGASTKSDGSFSITVGSGVTTLIISSVGFETQEVSVAGQTSASVSLVQSATGNLNEVVVIGYGTARKKDLTGAVSSVKAKDFNKGIQPAPDQLIQGKVAGVQVINNSGAPGAGTTIRIRGASSIRAGNTPLFVVDGVPLSNTNARPGADISADIGGSQGGGNTPSGNPLNFINPADIASMEVLKDASAAAIYGSRGANGVILITTKRGQSGAAKVDFNASLGVSNILKQLEVLNGDQYRQALADFGFPNTVSTPATPTANFGSNVDALGSVLQTGITQNYGVSLSSGNENARYRLSFGVLDQEGIIRKSDFKKYTAGLNSNFKLLNNKKLGVDFNVLTSQTVENIAPISNNAGFKGSLIGQALQWNPTKSLYKSDGTLNIEYGSDNINPLAYSEAYNDRARVTTVLASVAPSYKFTNELEWKTQLSINYSIGSRKAYTTAYININDIAIQTDPTKSDFGKGGEAFVSENELLTKQVTNTLSYVKDLTSSVTLNAVIGHEYLKTDFSGNSEYGRDIIPTDRPYYYFLASSDPGTRRTNGFADPTQELQSFFGRAIVNVMDKYVLTATMRADGSSKFGKENKYGYFPSFAGAWNISKEDFMSGTKGFLNDLKIRASWGITGNQEFPAGAARELYTLTGANPATLAQSQFATPDLKWESTTTFNVGVDFSLLGGRLYGNIDYFNRNTEDVLYPREAADPVTPISAVKWVNLPGNIINKGVEFTLNAGIIRKTDFTWDAGINMTFLKNNVENFGVFQLPTGEIHGQGLSGAYGQLLVTDKPLNTFYLKKFIGIDKATGISLYEGGEAKFFLGSPNPKFLIGFTTSASYKKFSLEVAFNGAYGHSVYNNTANAITSFNNIGKRNLGVRELEIAKSLGEKPVNPTSASSRYLEKGDYLRMSNATLSYNLGRLGKNISAANIFITGQNLFIITDFTGFDPEVNVNKSLNNITSFGMEYTPYPSARTINFGVNFSL
ncbi:MAG: SusC/RagA family TonB-linked outer membrane protein [Chitinophagaceae bacterium]|nr:SusC/RagA family TonB-linked outer membrane protein [Chitinophagaceae bacterium]